MKLIKPSAEVIHFDSLTMQRIEAAGRTCYKSESKITPDSSKKFIEMIINRGHESVLEHEKITVRIICDRGVSHELVRHRIASFSQESTRYCNYSKDKHDNQLTFIIPPWLDLNEGTFKMGEYSFMGEAGHFVGMLFDVEKLYNRFINTYKWQPQQARSVLPNSLKTEIVITANLREWRLIFSQRCATAAHPQMREIMIPLQKEFNKYLPVIFPL